MLLNSSSSSSPGRNDAAVSGVEPRSGYQTGRERDRRGARRERPRFSRAGGAAVRQRARRGVDDRRRLALGTARRDFASRHGQGVAAIDALARGGRSPLRRCSGRSQAGRSQSIGAAAGPRARQKIPAARRCLRGPERANDHERFRAQEGGKQRACVHEREHDSNSGGTFRQ